MRKSIKNLKFGFSDAQNHTIRANKTMLSSIFVKNAIDEYYNKAFRAP